MADGGSMKAGAAKVGAAAREIARVVKGDKHHTMMHAAVANEVIDAVNAANAVINALKNLKISPPKAGSFMLSDANAVLTLKGGSGGDDNLEEVTGAVNGVPATLQVQTDGNGWTEI